MRTIGLALVALLTCWAAAQAQIAAPRLNPLAFGTFGSSNPATLPWGGQSRFGGGLSDVSIDFTASGGSAIEYASGSGSLISGRLVGETFAFGVDAFSFDLDIITAAGGGTFELSNRDIGFALLIGEVFSIGVAQQVSQIVDPGEDSTDTLLLAGATVRLGESFFLGFASGNESLETENPSVPGSAAEGERGVVRYGVGYLSRNDSNGLHLEVYQEEADAFNSATFTEEAESLTGLTLEVMFSNILVGLEKLSVEETDTTGAITEEQESTTISLGWVPMEGLSIIASVSEFEINDISTGDLIVFNLMAIGISLGF